ncbi:serine/threonine-protein kinase [Nonomuraea jiangxiensis]|uniref:non-specific serine/threonine protein kinase n=1 Tax=Nonomuraea jiangxiensis TaxID=633440 RepID=A0A1G9MKC1_9ACTN|nr:serine/threonine-protein kinase [Nonomuraea jiangxiensis]SDL74523.1 Serine/threonine protein kinase [Nonomuraea jiangxiensis]
MSVDGLLPGDPKHIGRYVITGRLGAGGQGVVYLADAPDGTRVALKVIHAEVGSEARRLFEREFAVLRRVSSFCTAQVLDADVTADPPYIVSEYVAGPSLHAFVAEHGPITGAELDRLAVATATALIAIHRAGIVHRDFKPQNVLLGRDGPRVIDFGIARFLQDGAAVASAHVGTPRYMAPEQILGERFGPAADIFAWGATLVHAATGRSPFEAGSLPAVLYRVLHEPPDLGSLPGHLRSLVERCLSKDPADRPTASELPLSIMDVGLGPRAEPPPGVRTAAKSPRRLRRTLSASGAIVTAVTLAAGTLWWARAQETTTVTEPTTAGEPPAYSLAAAGAARTAFEAWYSLDYTDYDGGARRTLASLSGVAAQDYQHLIGNSKNAVTAAKAKQTARATAAGIVWASPERVSIIVTGLSTITQNGTPVKSEDPLLFAEMVPAGGGWKMDYARTTPSGSAAPAGAAWPSAEVRRMAADAARCQTEAFINGPRLEERPDFFDRCTTGRAARWWRELAAVPDDQVPDWWSWQYRDIGTAFERFDGPDSATLIHLGDSAKAPEHKVVAYRLHLRRVGGRWRLEDVTSPKDNRSMFERRPQ